MGHILPASVLQFRLHAGDVLALTEPRKESTVSPFLRQFAKPPPLNLPHAVHHPRHRDAAPRFRRCGHDDNAKGGVGGPNYTSSFHVIGEVFNRVYNLGSLTTAPMRDVQTTTVPPGGATVVDITLEVPGKFMLVDHALSRVERGLAGVLEVTGPDNPDIYKDYDPEKSAKSMSH